MVSAWQITDFRADWELETGPTESPVSLNEAKRHLKVEDTERDADITSLITAATERVESDTRRQLVTATWNLYYPQWAPVLLLPKPPISSVTFVKYVDQAGNLQTWESSQYQANLHKEPGVIRPAYAKSYPVLRPQEKAVQIQMVAGYGAASAVPEYLKAAIKLIVEGLFYGHEKELEGTIENLLNRYRWDAI